MKRLLGAFMIAMVTSMAPTLAQAQIYPVEVTYLPGTSGATAGRVRIEPAGGAEFLSPIEALDATGTTRVYLVDTPDVTIRVTFIYQNSNLCSATTVGHNTGTTAIVRIFGPTPTPSCTVELLPGD